MNGFDLIVIGGGPGGYVAALEAAKLGKTVAVVERDAVGGTCLNRGCIPTKALLRASRVFREATCSEELGIHVQNASCDRAAMYAHVQKVTAQLRSGIELLFQKGNITLLHGSAQIEAPGRVLVDGTPYEAQNLLIATGSLPAMPPIPGIHLPGVVTSDQLLQGDGVDCKRLAIIGGGVIGVEFAQIYSDLGCAVTILEALPRLLPTMDREISQNLSMILKKRGVSVYTGASVQEIASGDGELLCRFSQKGGDLETAADCLLVCTGRRPNTEGLFAASFDFPMERGYIPVDEQYPAGPCSGGRGQKCGSRHVWRRSGEECIRHPRLHLYRAGDRLCGADGGCRQSGGTQGDRAQIVDLCQRKSGGGGGGTRLC